MKKYLQQMGYWKNKPRGKPDVRYLSKDTDSKGCDNKTYPQATSTELDYEVFND